MAMEQCLTHTSFQNKRLEDDAEKWKSSSTRTDINSSGGFDCNICLDTVQDPVVTFCGHLYCWPCIYKWIHQQSISPEIPVEQNPQCPVCKAEISEKTLIPLYTGSDAKASNLGPVIPCRPKGPPCGAHMSVANSATRANQLPAHDHHGYPLYTSAAGIRLAGTTTFHPVISMFGEMICSGLYGGSGSFNSYPDSYSGAVASSSPRARRRVMQADLSLSRLSFFLCCCLVLCLVLF